MLHYHIKSGKNVATADNQQERPCLTKMTLEFPDLEQYPEKFVAGLQKPCGLAKFLRIILGKKLEEVKWEQDKEKSKPILLQPQDLEH